AAVGAVGAATADPSREPQSAIERAYRPLALPTQGLARIQHTDAAGSGGARVEAVLDRSSIAENRELVIQVRASVAGDLVGRRRILRSMIIGDNGDLRMETVGPETRLDHAAFELEIALGDGDPIRDWNLIRERIFALRVSMDVLDTDDFALSDDFLFKVRR